MSTKSENRTYDHMERQILALLADQDENRLRAFLVKQHPADIADVIDRLSERIGKWCSTCLPPKRRWKC